MPFHSKRRRTKSDAPNSLAPEAFDVGNAVFDFVGCEGGAEFEDFDVIGFDAGFESGEVNIA